MRAPFEGALLRSRLKNLVADESTLLSVSADTEKALSETSCYELV